MTASSPLTPEEQAELLRLHGEATAGPWELDGILIINGEKRRADVYGDRPEGEIEDDYLVCDAEFDDSALIVATVNALPRLLDTISSLTREAEALASAIDEALVTRELGTFERGGDAKAALAMLAAYDAEFEAACARSTADRLRVRNDRMQSAISFALMDLEGLQGADGGTPEGLRRLDEALLPVAPEPCPHTSIRPVASPIASAAYRCEACGARVAGSGGGDRG